MTEKYVHTAPGEQVESISGRYVIEKEFLLDVDGREALVVIGYMIIDKSCCGTGGCRYALVPGYAKGLRKVSEDGMAVTEVEPIESEAEQEKIRARIDSLETVQQINFL